MKQAIHISILLVVTILTGCNSFESRFYDRIDQGQIDAIRNGTDTLDLAAITDFEWDSVLLIRGNESVPDFKEQIEETLNNQKSKIHWEDRRFNNADDPKLVYKTTDLPINKDRFYFLTPDKRLVEKEIESGIHKHKPAFELIYCLADSVNTRYWLSKKECKFLLRSNCQTAGQGTVLLYPACKAKF